MPKFKNCKILAVEDHEKELMRIKMQAAEDSKQSMNGWIVALAGTVIILGLVLINGST